MAFFEEIGKKITQTGQGAVQKTKVFTEVTKLNGQISEQQKRIDNAYSQIGKLYYDLYNAEPDKEFAQWVGLIQEAQVQIKEIKEQIIRVKGTTRCPNCGSELQQGTLFCSVCGVKLEKSEESSALKGKFCQNCGTTIMEGQVFCANCGKNLTDNNPS